MSTGNGKNIFEIQFDKGTGIFLVGIFITFLVNKFLNLVWTNFAPLVVVGVYIAWILVSIYSSKCTPVFKLDNKELLFYQVIIPLLMSGAVGTVCASISGDKTLDFWTNLSTWIFNNENIQVLVIVFTFMVIICNFIAYERNKSEEKEKEQKRLNDILEMEKENREKLNDISESNRKNQEIWEDISKSEEKRQGKLDCISKEIEDIKAVLEQKNQVGYTATCIPIRFDDRNKTFIVALIKNISHKESQWMFPGSHIDITANQLREGFELMDLNVVPGKVIVDKAKKEAGLVELQFLDPYYEVVSYGKTKSGKKERDYPNTCYPLKAPVFNYLFRVNETARCYKEQNHRCHYDFTYIGEYSKIDVNEAEYEVIELEFENTINEMEYGEAIERIKAKAFECINAKIRERQNRRQRNQQNIPFNKLCLDSIPEMIYNAILFYSDYKKL